MSTGVELLFEIIAASVNASKQAAKIIRDVKKSGTMNIKEKGEKNDFVTVADVESQKLIVKYLKKLFPNINARGEEGKLEENPGDIKVDLSREVIEIGEQNAKELIKRRPDYNQISQEDLLVWIDPLDGTREYVMEGDQFNEEVTVLIGISYKGRPIAGVINQPYFERSNDDEFRDGIVWAIVGLGVFQNRKRNVSFARIEKYKLEETAFLKTPRKIVTSRSHATDIMIDNLKKIPDSDVIHRGGCGYKVLSLLDNEAHCYLYPSRGLKRWDTCAPEAVVRALGGEFTDILGERYDYSNTDACENTLGAIVAIRNHGFYAEHLPADIISHVWNESLKAKSH